jgi:hypothetical protein
MTSANIVCQAICHVVLYLLHTLVQHPLDAIGVAQIEFDSCRKDRKKEVNSRTFNNVAITQPASQQASFLRGSGFGSAFSSFFQQLLRYCMTKTQYVQVQRQRAAGRGRTARRRAVRTCPAKLRSSGLLDVLSALFTDPS